MRIVSLLTSVVVGILLSGFTVRASAAPETVTFPSGNKVLHGLLYKPAGTGPFPTVLYNHGSAPGLLNNQAFDLIAPRFTARGWVFFAPYRRGQGLSSDAGHYIQDDIQAAEARGGKALAAQTMVHLLSTEQLQDQLDALAWLKKQSFVRPHQIAVIGNSFGGIEAVLGAEAADYCAAVDASGGAESWEKAPELQELMLRAVKHSRSPIMFFQAENDYSLAPSRALYAAMKAANKPSEIRVYAAYGTSTQAGHSFAYRGASIWFSDVVRFLEANCK